MVVTRFAPSPTGYLHIGSARTALYSYLYARNQKGQFLLRIEDTDLERSTEASVEAIYEGMAYLGLSSDGEVIRQTQQTPHYLAAIEQMLASGNAYHCHCSQERLDAVRAEQQANGQKPKYDGHCRNKGLSATQGSVVRFKTPLDGHITFEDAVHGTITIQNSELDDLVIRRSDGGPTYNLTVVIDDARQKVTHVIRGDDHLNNTPRQIHMYQALGLPVPTFAHVSTILGPDGKRFSKRHGAVSIQHFEEKGILPEALNNYLLRLGWSHGDQELFTQDEMFAHFDLAHLHKSAATFDSVKLEWFNQQYLQKAELPRLVELTNRIIERLTPSFDSAVQWPPTEAWLPVFLPRATTLEAAVLSAQPLFSEVLVINEADKDKWLVDANREVLTTAVEAFESLEEWDVPALKSVFKSLQKQLDRKMGQIGPVLRVAALGTMQSPDLASTLQLLGQDTTVARLKQSLNT